MGLRARALTSGDVDTDPVPTMGATDPTTAGGSSDRITLRFHDERLESGFHAYFFERMLVSIRVAYVLGIATWAMWGLVIRQFTLETSDVDVFVRWAILIPVALVGLGVTFTRYAIRVWEVSAIFVLVFNALVWAIYVTAVADVPFDLGYVGIILIMTFSFTLVRLRFVLMAFTGIAMIGLYLGAVYVFTEAADAQVLLALFYLVSFYVLGMIAAYTLERSTRLLFLREYQLDRERHRSRTLLLNILPGAIAERLMERAEESHDAPAGGQAVADAHAEVAILFADMAGFTEQAGRISPEDLVVTLDDLFSEMDTLADRYGLEKIKTVGDAYMAVAGVPIEVDRPAARAMEMALDLVTAMDERRWPSGDPVRIRVGLASGPVVAGVIGRRKFAYDVWGDSVNLASRLQTAGRPGSILVTDAIAISAGDAFRFGPVEYVDLKGKGRQAVRVLLGRVVPSSDPGRAPQEPTATQAQVEVPAQG